MDGSQTGDQQSSDPSSGNQEDEQLQGDSDQSTNQYGMQHSSGSDLYGDSNGSDAYGDNGQMHDDSGMFDVSNSDSVVSVVQVSSAVVTGDTQQQDDTSVDFEQETFSTTDAMFDTQVSEAFSTGANISVVLSFQN